MARVFKIVLVLVGLYLVVMLGSGLVIKALLSGKTSSALHEELSRRFPVKVGLGGGDFDLKQWLLLRPAVTLEDLSIANPEGFSGGNMIEAGEISGQISLQSLIAREPRVDRITIVNPVVRIETNEYGRNNLSSLAPETEAGPAEPAGAAELGPLAINALRVSGGTVELFDIESKESLWLENVDVDVTGFSTTSDFGFEFSAQPFGGDRNAVSFTGRAGPMLQLSFPANGELSITLAPAEIPEEIRVRALGESMRAPGPNSIVRMNANVTGDLIETLEGGGTLTFDGFEFGRDAERQLPLSGTAPLALSVANALNNPVLTLNARETGLKLGDGTFNGDLQLSLGFGGTRGAVSGSINGVDIDQMLSAFTESSGQIYGQAAIPRFELSFRGTGSEELLNSLHGEGSITLDKGRITFVDTIGSVLDAAEAVLQITGLTRSSRTQEGAARKGGEETPFTTMSSGVSVANRTVNMTDIAIETPSGDISGIGSFTFDGTMEFDLTAHLTGEVANALGGKPDGQGVIRAAVPFAVTGTFEDPKVRPDLAHIGVGAAAGIIERLLGGKEGKEAEGEQEQQPSIFDIFKSSRKPEETRTPELQPDQP